MQVGKLLKTTDIGISKNSTIKETIIALARKENIPNQIIDDLVESNELNRLMSDFIRGIIDYAIIGDEKPTISYDAMKSLINFANNSLDDHINLIINKQQLEIYIEQYVMALNKLVPDRNEIVIDSHKVDIFRQILSFNVTYLYILTFLLILSIGLLLWNWYLPIKNLGIVVTISGVIFTVLGSLEWPIYNFIKLHISDMDNLIEPMLKQVLLIFFKEGVVYTIIGVFLIIIFVVINRFIRNKINLEKRSE